MFTMCLGWCLPPTKHRMSGSCHHGLLIRAVNTELDGVSVLAPTEGGPEPRGYSYSGPTAHKTAEAQGGEGPGGEIGGAGRAPGSLAPELTTQHLHAAASPGRTQHLGWFSA